MFRHIYLYSLKIFLRDKDVIFWSLLFPMILGTIFSFAFTNMLEGEKIETIPVAVVKGADEENIFEGVSLFEARETTETEALELLENNEVKGCVYLGDEPELVLAGTGYSETILKSYIESYERIRLTITDIMETAAGTVSPEEVVELLQTEGHTEEIKSNTALPDFTTNFIFTVMAFACMYSMVSGMRISKLVQVNQSVNAVRVSVGSVGIIKRFMGYFLSTLTIQCSIIIIIYLYLSQVLGIDFGNKYGAIIAGCILGALSGVSIGAAIGILLRVPESIKEGIIMGVSVLGGYLAGMMDHKTGYLIRENLPLLAKVNPANVITDTFYSLYYFETYDRFWGNVWNMIALSLACLVIVFVAIRRQKYESI